LLLADPSTVGAPGTKYAVGALHGAKFGQTLPKALMEADVKGPRGNNAESWWVLLRRAFLAACLLALGLPVAASAENGSSLYCTGKQVRAVPHSIADVDGYYATPVGQAVGLVVFFHGYGHTAKEWSDTHLARVAEQHHVIALAMEYPGALDESGQATEKTWQVAEGAAASNTVAQKFVEQCRGLDTVVSYGVSMGGNASGLAVASTSGLYDWWFDIEGANNVVETYLEARALAGSGDKFATAATQGIELEMDGKKLEDTGAAEIYQAHTNVFRVDDIVASGIKGVVMVHALDDGLVPYDQSREMQAAIGGRLPVQFWTVGTCTSVCDKDTTIDGYVQNYTDDYAPRANLFAGHSGELNYDSLVGNTGFERLDALFAGIEPTTNGEFVRDGDTGLYTKPEDL
jgi:hypothetical protein